MGRPLANRAHRLIGLDKRTGDIVYVASPGGRPYDTAYALPTIATINGMRLLIAGLGDGGFHAIKPQTGEKVWSFPVSKRAVNTGVVVHGNDVVVSQGDENLAGNELGLIGMIDGSQTGDIKSTKWAVKGTQFGFSSPLIDGTRIYQIDSNAGLHAYDLGDGHELWKLSLGTVQKAPPVLADGKIYVGTESGKFLIIRPHADHGEVLSAVEMPLSTHSALQQEGAPEQILAGAAISRGRVFFVSGDAIYALGPKRPKAVSGLAVDSPAERGEGAATWLQVSPTELVLKPSQAVKLHARLFDAKGRFLNEDPAATWALQGLKGTLAGGTFTASSDPAEQAGTIKATSGTVSGEARARVVHALPWTETFEAYADNAVPTGWVNAQTGKFSVTTLDGQKVLQKAPDNSIFKRLRVFVGPVDWSNYSVEADFRAPTKRRQMADVGLTAQRYTLTMFGNTQQLKLEPWEPEIVRTVTVPFAWKPDTWYHLKLRVDNTPDGMVRGRG